MHMLPATYNVGCKPVNVRCVCGVRSPHALNRSLSRLSALGGKFILGCKNQTLQVCAGAKREILGLFRRIGHQEEDWLLRTDVPPVV